MMEVVRRAALTLGLATANARELGVNTVETVLMVEFVEMLAAAAVDEDFVMIVSVIEGVLTMSVEGTVLGLDSTVGGSTGTAVTPSATAVMLVPITTEVVAIVVKAFAGRIALAMGEVVAITVSSTGSMPSCVVA